MYESVTPLLCNIVAAEYGYNVSPILLPPQDIGGRCNRRWYGMEKAGRQAQAQVERSGQRVPTHGAGPSLDSGLFHCNLLWLFSSGKLVDCP